MNPLTDKAIPIMLDQQRGRQKFIVEAYKPKIIQECMKLEITDGEQVAKALIQINKPEDDVRKVGKPYGNDSRYLI